MQKTFAHARRIHFRTGKPLESAKEVTLTEPRPLRNDEHIRFPRVATELASCEVAVTDANGGLYAIPLRELGSLGPKAADVLPGVVVA